MTVEEVIEMDMFAISVVRKLREKGHDEHAVMTRLLQTLSCQGYSETRLLIAGVKLEIYMNAGFSNGGFGQSAAVSSN